MKISLKLTLPLLLFAFIILSCKRNSNNYDNLKVNQSRSIKYNDITLDSIILDSINTSYVGNVDISKNELFFIDKKFCYVFKFNSDGKLIKRYLGQGSSNAELPIKNITLSTFLPNGNSVFIGTNWDVFIFNSEFNKVDEYDVNWHTSASREQMAKNPDPDEMYMYSFLYSGNIIANNEKLFFPVASQHSEFNPTIVEYGKNARILGKMDLQSGYVNDVFGRLSPVYYNNFNSLVFGYAMLDLISNKEIVVSFPADPLMYISDDQFVLAKGFGVSGRDMNIRYSNVKDPKLFHQNFKKEIEQKGYYTFIKFIKETNTLFRGYHKNDNSSTDGLQIYRNETLIADIDVPKKFQVSGFIAPYYYSNSYVNEDDHEIKLYKFQLN